MLRIQLFGSFQASADNTSLARLQTDRLQALLAYPVLHRGQLLSRHSWPSLSGPIPPMRGVARQGAARAQRGGAVFPGVGELIAFVREQMGIPLRQARSQWSKITTRAVFKQAPRFSVECGMKRL